MFPRCAPKNVELIGSPIGGSHDPTLSTFLKLAVTRLGYHKHRHVKTFMGSHERG